jgi:NAD(P)-dependent dehydrogenase (short-subunit alcohol dehydrogenase family)
LSRLAGKVAIVTGGAGGIGAATARALARRGAAVAVVDVDEKKAADTAAEIVTSGGDPIALGGDLSAESAAAAAVQSTIARFGRLSGIRRVAVHHRSVDMYRRRYVDSRRRRHRLTAPDVCVTRSLAQARTRRSAGGGTSRWPPGCRRRHGSSDR